MDVTDPAEVGNAQQSIVDEVLLSSEFKVVIDAQIRQTLVKRVRNQVKSFVDSSFDSCDVLYSSRFSKHPGCSP